MGQAELAYHKWLAEFLESEPSAPKGRPIKSMPKPDQSLVQSVPSAGVAGSVIEVASALLDAFEAKVRDRSAPKVRGTITRPVFTDRRKHVRDFLNHINARYGQSAVAKLRIEELTMHDIESFNLWIAQQGYSASQVSKRMQVVKWIIDRAGRPEHGGQRLQWNWHSRDVVHGKPTQPRTLPTLEQLQKVLGASDLAHRTMIWLAIGLGFGQRDIAALCNSHIDAQGFDLRRSKTGVNRFGETPPLVWAYIQAWLNERPASTSKLMFETRMGLPVVSERSDAITQWWHRLRIQIGENAGTLGGFYTLRHLGATEFGSRPGCSIGEMRRWLGHEASSNMADVYMRPIAPEHRELIEWVRMRLSSTDLDECQIVSE